MTAPDQQKNVRLPKDLREQFAALEQRLWRIETLATACAATASLLFSYWFLLLSDRIWETPAWFRAGLTGLGWTGVLVALGWWSRRWLLQPRGQRALAVLVQKQYRRLGDRLLGIVELADEKRRPAHFSPALYQAAIEQVAAEARPFDFTRAVNSNSARRLGWVVLVSVVLVTLPCLLSPAAAWNALQRWMLPLAPLERFTLVELQGLPGEKIVPHGEAFDLSWAVRYRSVWRPEKAVCRIDGQPQILARRQGNSLHVRIPGQVRAETLKVRVGDAWARVVITPMHRPSLKALTAAIDFPSYLQSPTEKLSVESGVLNVLDGSRVAFAGEASRSLGQAELHIGERAPQPLSVVTQRFSSDPMELDDVSEITFQWTDRFGLKGAAPWRLQLHFQKDSPPVPELAGLQRDTAILETEVLDIKAVATDDYGVREVGFTWELFGAPTASNAPPAQEFKTLAATPREKKLEEIFHFSPALLMLPADSVVELHGFATDYLPDRLRTETPVYRIHVLGTERHAELVRQNLEALLSELEEVTRLEEKVAAATRDLQAATKDKLSTNELSDKIAAAKDEQKQNAENLERLAGEGKKTLREAFRNPTFTEETLREWTKTLQSMQKLSEEKMQQAAKALESAQRDPEARSENLSQAEEKEKDVLQALEEMQRRVNKGLDDLQALTLAQRLRKIAGDEKGIAGHLQKIVPESIGLLPRELTPRVQEVETSLAHDQETAQKEAEGLHAEIGRFFERTQKENYGEVSKAMTEAHVTDELERVRGLIQENISMNAVQTLGEWFDRLNGWAALLEPKPESSAGGGGGQGSGGDDALLKELMGLLRVRDREVGLRHRTGLLDKQKSSVESYQQGAKTLALDQGKIREEVGKIQGENPVPALEFPLQDVIDVMQSAEGLLGQPQTGRETDLVQTKSVELVTDLINLINEQQQKGDNSQSKQSSSAAEMNFLMQMMAAQSKPAFKPGQNPKGGGNLAGGNTDRASTAPLGGATGKAGESRNVNGASGASANLPSEFRDALESYFRGMEKLESKP